MVTHIRIIRYVHIGGSMFQKENIISLEWKKRYESQAEEIKRELDDLSEAFCRI